MANRIRHLVDHMIATESDLGAECNFLEQYSLFVHGCDAQVRATKIHTDRELEHRKRRDLAYHSESGDCGLLIFDS